MFLTCDSCWLKFLNHSSESPHHSLLSLFYFECKMNASLNASLNASFVFKHEISLLQMRNIETWYFEFIFDACMWMEQWKKYTGARGEIAPEIPKRVQCKTNFRILFSGRQASLKSSPPKININFFPGMEPHTNVANKVWSPLITREWNKFDEGNA